MTFGAVIFWLACAVDGLLMRLSPKYKASRFYDESTRLFLKLKHDPECYAFMRESLLEEYGYKKEP